MIPYSGLLNKANGAFGQLEGLWKEAIKTARAAQKKLNIDVEVVLKYSPADPLRPIGMDVITRVDGVPRRIQIDATHNVLTNAQIIDLRDLLGI